MSGSLYRGLCRRRREPHLSCWGYIGIMENNMENYYLELTVLGLALYWGYIGIMNNEMEITM